MKHYSCKLTNERKKKRELGFMVQQVFFECECLFLKEISLNEAFSCLLISSAHFYSTETRRKRRWRRRRAEVPVCPHMCHIRLQMNGVNTAPYEKR